MSEQPEGEKTKATVYRQREPPKTALEQWRFLEAEALEEENTERARFFDLHERLSHALSMIDDHLMGMPETDEKKRYQRRLDDLTEILADATFDVKWVNTGRSQGMSHREAAAWAYQQLNARARVALSKAKALMVHLGIYALKTGEEIEEQDEVAALRAPMAVRHG